MHYVTVGHSQFKKEPHITELEEKTANVAKYLIHCRKIFSLLTETDSP